MVDDFVEHYGVDGWFPDEVLLEWTRSWDTENNVRAMKMTYLTITANGFTTCVVNFAKRRARFRAFAERCVLSGQ